MKKKIIGLTEKIKIIGKNASKTVVARIDTGATRSSIDAKLAARLLLGPVVKTTLVKSAHGNRVRPVIRVHLIIAGKEMREEFTIADREHMRYDALIGRNVLRNTSILIDPRRR
jgi:hypothetical protein